MATRAPVGQGMAIDVVDETDRPIGRIRRGDALSRGVNFRTVHMFVCDRARERLLLQHIPKHRERHPGYWGSSVAGYLYAGETYLQGAERRLGQELGIDTSAVRLFECGKTSMTDINSRKFVTLYLVFHDGPFHPDESHIASLRWLDVTSVEEVVRTGELEFTPTFRAVWKLFCITSCSDEHGI